MLKSFNISRCKALLLPGFWKCLHTSSTNRKWPSAISYKESKGERIKKNIKIWENMTVWDLAKSMKVNLDYVNTILKPTFQGKMNLLTGEISDLNAITSFLEKKKIYYKISENVQIKQQKLVEELNIPKTERETGELVKRPPLVTIMGHVDHGKTTLLDALRNSNIVEGEFGGITQHIGAFTVSLAPGKTVTFIDTPGHAAFSAMRNRGAEVTDIVVLIVAADDGVMEQTVESIKMARNAGVQIIVAVNKIDKGEHNLENIKQQLLSEGLQAEDLGGHVQVIPISALKRKNLSMLIEAILIEAEIMGLTGDPNGMVEGVVIESFKGPNGKTTTVIVKRGTLRKRAVLVAGSAMARVRNLFDTEGNPVTEVTLSQPAQVVGWRDALPNAGEKFVEVICDKEAYAILKQRKRNNMLKKAHENYIAIQEKSVKEKAKHVEQKKYLHSLMKESNVEGLKEFYSRKPTEDLDSRLKLDIIVKGDVDGSVDAIMDLLETYNRHDLCQLKCIHHGVGEVTENDVDLAELFNATIYCFNVNYSQHLKEIILEKDVRIKFHNVIYKFFEDLREEINGLLPPGVEESIIGEADVLQPFTVSEGKQKVPVAGCVCVLGELKKNENFRVIRNNSEIYNGKVKSLKHFKNEVNSIKKDSQCGIRLQDFQGTFQAGDKIICYTEEEVCTTIDWNPGF